MDEKFNVQVGLRIFEARKNKKMTRAELGKMVNLHESTVKRYEDGQIKSLDIDKLKDFANALDIDPAYLIGWKEDHNQSADPISQNVDFAKNDEERKVLLIARKADELPPEKREKVINFFEETIDTYLAAMGDIFHKNNSEGEQ